MAYSNQKFLPSSPIGLHVYEDANFGAESKTLSLNKDTLEVSSKTAFEPNTRLHENYPSPLPSSSTGDIFSPLKHHSSVNLQDPCQNFLSDELTLSCNKEIDSSPIKNDILNRKIATPATNLSIIHNLETNKKKMLLHLHPRMNQTFNIGRQTKFCNIVLPKKSLISRNHAKLMYKFGSNQIILECLGLNGLIVVLPRKLSCHLVSNAKVNQKHRLFAIKQREYKKKHNLNDANYDNHIVNFMEKDLVIEQNLTSFILNKNEIVVMPFMENTIIDFRNAVLELKMKQLDYVDDKSDNEVEVDSTTLVNNYNEFDEKITKTNSQHVYMEPKPIGLPLTINKTIFSEDFPEKLHHPSDNIKRQLPIKNKTTSIHHPNKRMKNQGISKNIKTDDEIINSLNNRDIDCEDIQHVLTNYLAFANIQQTPLSQIKIANSKTKVLSDKELRALLNKIACIGVIYRKGKDAAGKPLEEEYYYEIENDDDQERKYMIQSIKGGRTSLRSCRKTHKQYFWKKPSKK